MHGHQIYSYIVVKVIVLVMGNTMGIYLCGIAATLIGLNMTTRRGFHLMNTCLKFKLTP